MLNRQGSVNIDKPKLGSREQRRSPRRTKTPSSNEIKNKCKFSPKGKRKLDFKLKENKPGPLAGKLFYLDISGSRLIKLRKAIEQLGGTIEEFFRKEVTCLVTSRGDCGKSPSSQSTPSPILPTISSSMKNYAAASPMSTDSPESMDTYHQPPFATTRGRSIAQRSAGYKKGSIDIFTNAAAWGVHVVHVDRVIEWVLNLLMRDKNAARNKTSSPSKRISQAKLPKVVALQETYIKAEDVGFKYRPLFHEFKVWPEIIFHSSNVCPFDPPRQKSAENSNPKETGTKDVKKPPIHERPKHGYCECCEVRYADLDMHLKGNQHKEFSRKDLNYVSLDKAIKEGPKIGDLLKEIQLKKSNSFAGDTPVLMKNNLFRSSNDQTDDLLEDEVFFLSTPRRSPRNVIRISDDMSSGKVNQNDINEKQNKASLVDDAVLNLGSVQGTVFVSKPSTPTRKSKVIASSSTLQSIDAKKQESPKSGPVTRLRKASHNLSGSEESKNLSLSTKQDSGEKIMRTLKAAENEGDSKYPGVNKRKSTEQIEKCSELDFLEFSKHKTSRKRQNCTKTVSELKYTENEEESKSVELMVEFGQLDWSQEKDPSKHSLRQMTITSTKVMNNSETQQSTFNQSSNKVDIKETKKNEMDVNETKNVESYQRKRKSPSKLDYCNEIHFVKRQKFPGCGKDEKNKENVARNQNSIDGKNSIEEGKGCGVHVQVEESKKLWRIKRQYGKNVLNSSDTEESEQQSKDSPLRVKTPPKNTNCFSMCPGALLEESHRPTSTRRRSSALANCGLSPIQPCILDGEYSVRSSNCSEEIEFLPFGMHKYSSFFSSLDGVSKDVNYLVGRIKDEFHSDEDDANVENAFDFDHILAAPKFDTSSVRSKIMLKRKAETCGNLGIKAVNTELQVSLTPLIADAIYAARGNDSGNVKRKRKEEDESLLSQKGRRKRRSVASDSQADDAVESSENGLHDVDQYRASVGERVKLQRAIIESRKLCSSPPAVSKPLSTPKMQSVFRKRKGVQKTHQQPLNACLIPNDPFNFDDH